MLVSLITRKSNLTKHSERRLERWAQSQIPFVRVVMRCTGTVSHCYHNIWPPIKQMQILHECIEIPFQSRSFCFEIISPCVANKWTLHPKMTQKCTWCAMFAPSMRSNPSGWDLLRKNYSCHNRNARAGLRYGCDTIFVDTRHSQKAHSSPSVSQKSQTVTINVEGTFMFLIPACC